MIKYVVIVALFLYLLWKLYSMITFNSISSLLNYVSELNGQNSLLFMYMVYPFLNNIIYHIKSLLSFISSSTFVTWYHVNSGEQDGYWVYAWVQLFINEKYQTNEFLSLTTRVETAQGNYKLWYNPDIVDDLPQIRYLPGSTWGVFFFKGKPVLVNYMGASFSMTTFCWPWNRNGIWCELIDEVREHFREKHSKFQDIYRVAGANGGVSFMNEPMSVERLSLNDGDYILTDDMKRIITEVENFLKPETRDEYKKKKLKYAMRIYTHGPPGTGKSQLPVRLAGEFKLGLYYINCQGINDAQLINLFDTVQRGIIVVEEIDKCIYELVNKENKGKDAVNVPRLSAWHEVMDNIKGQQVIVYFTTNNFPLLRDLNHGSLIRAERIDCSAFIGMCHLQNVNDLLSKHFNDEDQEPGHVKMLDNNDIFLDSRDRTLLSMADVISCIKFGKGDYNNTINKIKAISKTRSANMELRKITADAKHIKKF